MASSPRVLKLCACTRTTIAWATRYIHESVLFMNHRCKQTVAFHYNESQVPHNMLPECNVLKASNLHVLEVLQALMKKHHIQHVYLAFIGPSKVGSLNPGCSVLKVCRFLSKW